MLEVVPPTCDALRHWCDADAEGWSVVVVMFSLCQFRLTCSPLYCTAVRYGMCLLYSNPFRLRALVQLYSRTKRRGGHSYTARALLSHTVCNPPLL